MQSIELALLFDYVRKVRLGLALAFVTMTAVPLFLYSALSWEGGVQRDSPPAIALHVVFTQMMGFGASIPLFAAIGSLQRFYVRPISTARLVASTMAMGMVSVAGCYFLSASILNLSGTDWPVIGPTLFITTAFAWAVAAIWWFDGSVFGQLLSCCAVISPLVMWFNGCYGARFMGHWNRMWREPSATEILTLVSLSLLAYVVAVLGVAQTRRGDLWNFDAVAQWWERRWAAWPTSAPIFRTPFAAQLWFEWNQKLGPAPAVLVACFFVLMMALRMLGYQESQAALEVSVLLPLAVQVYILPLIFGIVLGNCGDAKKMRGMSHFYGTRPLTDRSLASAMLLNCAYVTVSIWLTWIVGVTLVLGLVTLMGDWPVIARLMENPSGGWRQTVMLATVAPIAAWSLLAIVSSIVATGREWFWSGALLLSCSGVLIYGLICKFLLYQYADQLFAAGLIFLGAAFVLVTVSAFMAALRRGLVTSNAAITAGGLAIAGGAVLLLFWPATLFRPQFVTLGIGNLALVFLPIAAMPLAVHWNRHR